MVDPFSGSATTLTVAKKLGRRFLGFDISKEYVKLGLHRIATVCVGDRLDGAPEPTMALQQRRWSVAEAESGLAPDRARRDHAQSVR